MKHDIIDPLIDKEALIVFLREHNLGAQKAFGQHFLCDRDVLEEIIKTICTPPPVQRIEVGAGLGVLTTTLAHTEPTPLIAVEKDRTVLPLLRKRTHAFPHVRVVAGNILDCSLSQLLVDTHLPYDVVGNIPYNITSPLLQHVLSWNPPPRRVVFLVDAAVAERVSATPPHMSLLALTVQTVADAECVGLRIPPRAFFPPPKVSSTLLVLTPRSTPRIPLREQSLVFHCMRGGFSQKRKTLTNALGAYFHLEKDNMEQLLSTAHISPERRAQTLSIEEWYTLAQHLLREGVLSL